MPFYNQTKTKVGNDKVFGMSKIKYSPKNIL